MFTTDYDDILAHEAALENSWIEKEMDYRLAAME
jgi:hypothetical protein